MSIPHTFLAGKGGVAALDQPPVGWFTWQSGRGSGSPQYISADTTNAGNDQVLSGAPNSWGSSFAFDHVNFTVRLFQSNQTTGYKWQWNPSTKSFGSGTSFNWSGPGLEGYNYGSAWAHNGYFGWVSGGGSGNPGYFRQVTEGGSVTTLTTFPSTYEEESLGQAGKYVYATGYSQAFFGMINSTGTYTSIASIGTGLNGAMMVSPRSDSAIGVGVITSTSARFYDHATQSLSTGTTIYSRNGSMSSMYGGHMAYVDWPKATAGTVFSAGAYGQSLVSITNQIGYSSSPWRHSAKGSGGTTSTYFSGGEGGIVHDPITDNIYIAGGTSDNSPYQIYRYNRATDAWDSARTGASGYMWNRGRARTCGCYVLV
jgi:hypothetical protein